MTPNLTLEFVIFLIVLLVVSAAFDLWVIRAWKRRNARLGRGGEHKDFTPAPDGSLSARKAPGGTAGVSPLVPAQSGAPGKPPSAGNPPAAKSPAPSDPHGAERKRGARTVSQSAAFAVKGKTGRTAHVRISMDLPEGESIRVTLESVGGGVTFSGAEKGPRAAGPETRAAAVTMRDRMGAWRASGSGLLASLAEDVRTSGRSLFALALILYLLTRLIGLARWPIYFFTDEAVQTNFAAELVDRNFSWAPGEPIPVFFENAGQYEMNFSVYVQIIPYILFGKSVFVTRGVSVLITVLGVAAVGGILRRVFRLPLWWSGVLLLSITPVWFLHSRTAFEPGEAISFYALFLYFYMRCRDDKPWMLLPALFFGTLAAYTYSPMQVIMAVTGALLLISDAGHHWRHKWISLAGLALLLVLAMPYLWFLRLHPDANRDQLAIVGSYWLNDISFPQMLGRFFQQYLHGLDPRYWYLANPPETVYHDIIRHLMKGYGHFFLSSLPFAVVGILLCLTNIRKSQFRTVLAALLAAPTGGAVAQITITRVLVMVIPAALLTALGIHWLLALFERDEIPPLPDFLNRWRERTARTAAAAAALGKSLASGAGLAGARAFLRSWRERTDAVAAASKGIARIPRAALALGLFLVLGSANVYMLWDSLTNGPTWYDNYQLYGMQYGGEQLCSALVAYQKAHPEANLIVSSSWANGTDEIYSFFLPPKFEMKRATVIEYIQNYVPIGPQDVFVMTSEEYSAAELSERFAEIEVEQTLDYPNGSPGFYFARLTYVDNIQEIIAAEQEELAKPVEEVLDLGGEAVRVVHSRFDMGTLSAGFDANPFSLMRTQQDNPMALDFYFPEPHRFTRVMVRVGGAPTRLTVTIYPEGGGDPVIRSTTVDRSSDYRNIEILLDTPVQSRHLRLEIETVGEGEPTHVHVYEIELGGEGWKSGIVGPSP
jgi:4-amino-4-deoxy-L-arabinose transferase-like glycosyltransferase